MAYKQIINDIPNDAFLWGQAPSLILKDTDDNRWFLATDIARVLGYSRYNEALALHLNNNNRYIKRFGQIKGSIEGYVSPRVLDDWRFLSEEGLYHFILSSKRKPYAKQLKAEYF